MSDVALRYNLGKVPLGIVPPSLTIYTAAVMDFGAQKYSMHNWRKGFPYTSILNSLERHLADFKAGVDYDPETKLHQLAHIACNVAFLIEHVEQGYGVDDRYKLESPETTKLRASE